MITPTQQTTLNRLARSVHGFISDWSCIPYGITNTETRILANGEIQASYSVGSGRWHDKEVFISVIIGKRGGLTKYSHFEFLESYEGAKAAKEVNRFMDIYAQHCKVNH
jgi:hypothetical protein